MSEGKGEWYDRQANVSKLLTYAAFLIFLGGAGWAGWEGYEKKYSEAMGFFIAATAVSGMLIAFSAIIDLMIVHAEALRDRD